MTETDTLKDRLAAPDWDMWLTLGANLLERLADAKHARRTAVVPVPQAAVKAVPATRRGPAVAVRAAPAAPRGAAQRAARRLNRAAGMLAATVLVDGVVARIRGQDHGRAAGASVAAAALSLAVSAHGAVDRRPVAHSRRAPAYATVVLAGLLGSVLHIRSALQGLNGSRLSGLWRAVPLGAPAALTLSGAIGSLAERVRGNRPGAVPRVFGLPAGRVVGATAAAGLLATLGGTGLRHTPGARRDPLTYLAVAVPPVAAWAAGRAASAPGRTRRRGTRWLLRAAALAGLGGSALRLRGLGRAPGGWGDWRRNLVEGPPIPAPPAFTGLALAGLAALDLLEGSGG